MKLMRRTLAFLVLGALALPGWAGLWDLQSLDWSPDGEHVILVVRGALYVGLAPEGRDLRPVYPELPTSWARFGGSDWFVFVSPTEGGFTLWRGYLEGEADRLYLATEAIGYPTVSPDGARVAFVQGTDLVVLEIETGKVETVLKTPWAKATPEFTPAGLGLIFTGFWPEEGEETSWDLFYLDLQSQSLFQLTVDPYFDWCPRISPDGAWIAFVSNRGGNPDIHVLNFLDGTMFPVTQDPWLDGFPSWSPDGSEIGYASLRQDGWVLLSVGTY